MNRNVRIQFRLTKEEHKKLLELAEQAAMNVSEFLRTCIMRTQITPRPSVDLHEFTMELRRIGNNINQIAVQAHTHHYFNTPHLDEQLNELWKLEQQISALFLED